MRRPRETDLGISLLCALHDHLQVGKKWGLWQKRGFVWWPCGLAQHIVVDRSVCRPGGETTFQVQMRTDLFEGCAQGVVAGAMLNGWARQATTSALARHPSKQGQLQLACQWTVSAGQLSRLQPLFFHMARSQVLEAADLVVRISELGRSAALRPVLSAHPQAGVRLTPSRILEEENERPLRLGAECANLLAPELERFFAGAAAAAVSEPVLEAGGGTLALAEAEGKVLLELHLGHHGQAGAGLFLRVHLAGLKLVENNARPLLEWNDVDLAEGGGGFGLGCWGIAPTGLVHTVFLPNALLAPGLPSFFAGQALERARWAGRRLRPRSSPEGQAGQGAAGWEQGGLEREAALRP